MSLEHSLVMHCAPTLAGIKTANLYRFRLDGSRCFANQFRHWRRWFSSRGLELRILAGNKDSLLLYLYRPVALQEVLSMPGVGAYLTGLGYALADGQKALLHRLSARVRSQKKMPDEIGIFLGYPLEDVLGFTQNKGKNYTCAGCWKCYGDPEEAQRRFDCYRACTADYRIRFAGGAGVKELTVAA